MSKLWKIMLYGRISILVKTRVLTLPRLNYSELPPMSLMNAFLLHQTCHNIITSVIFPNGLKKREISPFSIQESGQPWAPEFWFCQTTSNGIDNDENSGLFEDISSAMLSAFRMRYSYYHGPLLLRWFNLNPSIHRQAYTWWRVGWNYLSITYVEVWEWINYFILHFIMHEITYPC